MNKTFKRTLNTLLLLVLICLSNLIECSNTKKNHMRSQSKKTNKAHVQEKTVLNAFLKSNIALKADLRGSTYVKDKLDSKDEGDHTEEKHDSVCNAGPITDKGRCISYTLSDLSKFIPKDFRKPWKTLAPAISQTIMSGDGIQACRGQFMGSEIKGGIKTDICNSIPVVDRDNFEVLAFSLPIPCPATPKVISICVAWSECGTFAISFNGKLPGCIVALAGSTTGILASVGAASEAINQASIGFSDKKQFSQSVKIIRQSGDDLVPGDYVIHGHIFVSLGIQLPTEFLDFGDFKFSDFIQINANAQLLVNFGDAVNIVSNTIQNLRSLTVDKAKKVISDIITEPTGEFILNLDGQVSIGLRNVSGGLIPDLSFSLGNAALYATKGRGETGLDSGIYLKVDTNAAKDLINSIKGFVKSYDPVLKFFGINLDKIPTFGIELGLVITSRIIAFLIKIGDCEIKCMFKFDGKSLSCGVGGKFFNALIEGVKVAFRAVGKFFEGSGKLIAEKTTEAFIAANKAISEGVNKSIIIT